MSNRLQQRFQQVLTGRYRLERELARGGMSTVFLAQDERHDRRVAIKLLQPEIATAITAERFVREVRITARLQHPHILPLLDSGVEDGLCYYVMPHVEGESLRERLMLERKVPLGMAVRIARQVAEALAYAHGQQVVHRDIKPENILLLQGQAIVADFGLARAMSEASSGITAAGLPIGTPAYMSPEQAIGAVDIDGRSDQYSLGCVLYEMLGGRPPFTGSTIHGIIDQHLSSTPVSLRTLRDSVSSALEDVVSRMMSKEAQDRFENLTTVAEQLGLIAAEEALDRVTVERETPRPSLATGVPAVDAPLGHTPDVFRKALVVVGLIAVAALAVFALLNLSGGRRARAGEEGGGNVGAPPRTAALEAGFLTSIAAMPLETFGGDSAAETLSAGLTEELIAQLSRIRRLKVISRTSVTALKGRGLTVPQIADTLGVDHVLEGSVQRGGSEVRITLQLIDARSDAHIWSESYTRAVGNLLRLREEIANKVAAQLAIAVPGLESMRANLGTANEEAFDAFSRGLHAMDHPTPEGVAQAIASFEEALREDPGYGDAAAHLADALAIHVHLGYPGRGDLYTVYGQALRVARSAVEIDPNSGPAWSVRGLTRVFSWRPIDEALTDIERALTLAPNSGEIRVGYGMALARAGRYEEAVAASRSGAEMDPLSPITRVGGFALTAMGARQFDLAVREANRALRLDPDFEAGKIVLAAAEMLAGRPEVCLAMDLPITPALTANCHHALGQTGEATRIGDSLGVAYQSPGAAAPFELGFLAAYHARLGDVAQAIAWLERAFATSPTAMDFRFFDAGLYRPASDDPAFQQSLQRIRMRIRDRIR